MMIRMNNLFRKHEMQFIAWFAGVFLATVALLAVFGLLPNEFEVNSGGPSVIDQIRFFVMGVNPDNAIEATAPVVTGSQHNAPSPTTKNSTIAAEEPTRIVIPSGNVDVKILNPKSTDPDYLDNELTRGTVHYPGSGFPGSGNMFIFGHSTGFKVVQNEAYKAFNNLSTLHTGDSIMVYSAKHTYAYKVRNVKKVDKNDTWVRFDGSSNMLTLSTCDSFGTKADRYVVEADYVGISS